MTAAAVRSPLALVLPRPAARRALRQAVLAWFDRRGRALAFRQPPDPWGVLVSEVMAQQTQIARVEERWPAFMAAFPTPAAAAAVSPADVIREWRGLGYNRRALNLHRAATAIVAAGGAVPGDVDSLRALPGVGPYTARAVAAIAFGRPVGAVDVNVRRVLGRIAGLDPAAAPSAALQAAADTLVDPDRPGDWTHALMDLGATVCRPALPACRACPARRWCRAEAGMTAARARPGGTSAPGAPADRRPVPFERTSRWLRGRIVEQLRDAPPGVPVDVAGPIGPHAAGEVAVALAALAADGMVELDAAGRARLPGIDPPAESTRAPAPVVAARGRS